MKYIKKVFLASIFFILASSGAATGIGSYTVDKEKTTATSRVNFSLKVMNPSSEILKLNLETRNSSYYSLKAPNLGSIKPSKITKNPKGEGWYYLGNGKYIETKEIEFTIIIDKYKPELEIPVTLEAIRKRENSDSGISGTIVYANQFKYKISPKSFLKPSKNENKLKKEMKWNETGDFQEEDENEKKAKAFVQRNASQTYKPKLDKQKDNKTEINGLTKMYLIGILLLSIYIYRVV